MQLHHLVNIKSTPNSESFFGVMVSMELEEKRCANLKRWKSENGVNNAELSRRIARSQSYVSDLLRGEKSFGEKVSHAIEKKLSLPHGWLDRDEDGEAIPTAPAPLPPDQKQLLDAYCNGGPVKQAALAQLAALPEQEMGMLLMVMQSAAAKYPPANPQDHLRTNERRAAEKLVREGMTEPPEEAPLFSRRKQIK